ncbi:uncharacterized protein [Rhodnius prolixus]|uniref:uncharacterized protein n=1 Tax=Rhodnius prolixus TaxID=13249 RepID=UPI003D18E368
MFLPKFYIICTLLPLFVCYTLCQLPEDEVDAVQEIMSPLRKLFSTLFEIEYSSEEDTLDNFFKDLDNLFLTIGLESGRKPTTTTTTTEEPTTTVKRRTTTKKRQGK